MNQELFRAYKRNRQNMYRAAKDALMMARYDLHFNTRHGL